MYLETLQRLVLNLFLMGYERKTFPLILTILFNCLLKPEIESTIVDFPDPIWPSKVVIPLSNSCLNRMTMQKNFHLFQHL